MKKLLIPVLVVFLTACATTSNKTISRLPFPAFPSELNASCPDLIGIDPATEKLSDVITIVSTNYNTYYKCKIKVDGWIEWYNAQKKISAGVK